MSEWYGTSPFLAYETGLRKGKPMNTKTLRTHGISPKAILAFTYPVIAAAIASVGSWVVTGDFNANEIRVAVGELAGGSISLIGAIVGRPGDIPSRSPVT